MIMTQAEVLSMWQGMYAFNIRPVSSAPPGERLSLPALLMAAWPAFRHRYIQLSLEQIL